MTTTQVITHTKNGHDLAIELRPVSAGPTYVISCCCGEDGPWETYSVFAAELAIAQHTRIPPAGSRCPGEFCCPGCTHRPHHQPHACSAPAHRAAS